MKAVVFDMDGILFDTEISMDGCGREKRPARYG